MQPYGRQRAAQQEAANGSLPHAATSAGAEAGPSQVQPSAQPASAPAHSQPPATTPAPRAAIGTHPSTAQGQSAAATGLQIAHVLYDSGVDMGQDSGYAQPASTSLPRHLAVLRLLPPRTVVKCASHPGKSLQSRPALVGLRACTGLSHSPPPSQPRPPRLQAAPTSAGTIPPTPLLPSARRSGPRRAATTISTPPPSPTNHTT